MALRRTPQQMSAWNWGGIEPMQNSGSPQPAPWQLGGKSPQGAGGQAPAPVQDPVGDLTGWMQSLYPDQPTTPQPLEGGYGSGAWNILDPFGGVGMGGAGAGVPAPSQISTGITQPNIPSAPTMPGQGAGPQGLGSQATQDALAANWPQAVQPEFMKLMASYYPQAAGLQGGFEQARAQAGLGWGGQQAAQQGSLLQMLKGLV